MLCNLLLTDPDNIPVGYGGLDTKPLSILLITILAILVTVIFACVIIQLNKKCNENKSTKFFTIGMIIVTIIICVIYILLCVYAVN